MNEYKECPTQRELTRYGSGQLERHHQESVERHLAGCAWCTSLLAALPAMSAPPTLAERTATRRLLDGLDIGALVRDKRIVRKERTGKDLALANAVVGALMESGYGLQGLSSTGRGLPCCPAHLGAVAGAAEAGGPTTDMDQLLSELHAETRSNPSPETYLALSLYYQVVGSQGGRPCGSDLRRSRTYLEQAALHGLDPATFANEYGLVLLAEGNLEEALERLRDAVEERPDFVAAIVNMAVVQERLGRADEARESWARVETLTDDDDLRTYAKIRSSAN